MKLLSRYAPNLLGVIFVMAISTSAQAESCSGQAAKAAAFAETDTNLKTPEMKSKAKNAALVTNLKACQTACKKAGGVPGDYYVWPAAGFVDTELRCEP